MMPEPQDRQIRVFISSTFRDMGAERDHLVKFIFPQLRKLCESRGVTWGEVDLRWGVTDEEAAEGKVLPICLEEIKRCRPYFIGILGERYGWVPDSISEELIEREPWLKEQMEGHKSVTELEILHGVLLNPKMAGYAYFYFRDSAYLDNLPPETKRENFTSEDACSREKLQKLKQQIKGSGFPVRDNYADPKAMGELVLADLTKIINGTWHEGSQPDPLDREAMDHEAFAQSRAKVYIGRDEYFKRLDAHANAIGDQPLVILGESGSGKSALLANWALKHRAAHPGDFLLMHFIGGTPYSSDWAAMLRRIMSEFKRKLGIAQDIPDQPDALRGAFANWLHMAAAKARIILIFDALNQLEDRDGAQDLVWLPPVMPGNVRLIVSTLSGRPLNEINKRKWPVFKVQALDMQERQRFITAYLDQYTKALSFDRSACIASARQSANPLYLRTLLEELRLFGEHERLDERITHYLNAGTVPELYEKILARWEQDYEGDTDLVGDAMTLLWAARRGLTETELLQALGEGGEPLPRALWSPIFLALGDSLMSQNGLLTFFHDYLREAVKDAYIPSEESQRDAHIRLADYFEPHPLSSRQLEELPWQLTAAQSWDRLFNVLKKPKSLVASWRRNQFEVKQYWEQIERGSKLRKTEAFRSSIQHPDEEPDKHFLWILSLLLDHTGNPQGALALRANLSEHFGVVGDLENQAGMLGGQAVLLEKRGDLDGALALLLQAERICRIVDNPDGLHRALGMRGVVMLKQNKLDAALRLINEAERISRNLGDLDAVERNIGNKAEVLRLRGDLHSALVLQKEKELLCKQIGQSAGLLNSLGCQGLIMVELRRFDEAMMLFKTQESLCRQMGNIENLAQSLRFQAQAYSQSGRPQDALLLLSEALELASAHGYKALAGEIKSLLASAKTDTSSSSRVPISVRKESSIDELREMAERAIAKCQWEGAETMYRKIFELGEPLKDVAPKIVTCLLNAHDELLPHDSVKIEVLLKGLETDGHTNIAGNLRRQLEAKMPKSKKPWWKFW